MDNDESMRKLRQIERLPIEELLAWEVEAAKRGFFNGEKAAILSRKIKLGPMKKARK